MATWRPLALIAGVFRQVPTGDTLPEDVVPVIIASQTSDADSKLTLVDADSLPVVDSEDSGALKKISLGGLRKSVLPDGTSEGQVLSWGGTAWGPGLKITVSSSEPSSPSTGDIWISF